MLLPLFNGMSGTDFAELPALDENTAALPMAGARQAAPKTQADALIKFLLFIRMLLALPSGFQFPSGESNILALEDYTVGKNLCKILSSKLNVCLISIYFGG